MGKLAIGEGRPYVELNAKAAERTASRPKLVHENTRFLFCTVSQASGAFLSRGRSCG
jgi:hypothetical protein